MTVICGSGFREGLPEPCIVDVRSDFTHWEIGRFGSSAAPESCSKIRTNHVRSLSGGARLIGSSRSATEHGHPWALEKSCLPTMKSALRRCMSKHPTKRTPRRWSSSYARSSLSLKPISSTYETARLGHPAIRLRRPGFRREWADKLLSFASSQSGHIPRSRQVLWVQETGQVLEPVSSG